MKEKMQLGGIFKCKKQYQKFLDYKNGTIALEKLIINDLSESPREFY